MVSAAVSTSCSAWRRSSSVATPPVCRDLVRSSDSCARLQGSLRDLELVVQLAHRQVSSGDVADQRGDHGLAVFLRAQKIARARLRWRGAACPTDPLRTRAVQRRFSEVAILRWQKLGRDWRRAVARESVDLHATAGAELRKLVRSRNPQIRASRFHARHRVAKVVVLH